MDILERIDKVVQEDIPKIDPSTLKKRSIFEMEVSLEELLSEAKDLPDSVSDEEDELAATLIYFLTKANNTIKDLIDEVNPERK